MKNRGFVLVSVLWVLAMLSVIALGFGRRSVTERRLATYSADYQKALYMARGAVERGIVELRNRGAYQPEGGRNSGGARQRNWKTELDLLGPGESTLYYSVKGDPDFGNEVCSYWIEDAASWIDINNAPEELLEEIDGLSRSAVRSIVRRRDRGGPRGAPAPFGSMAEVRTVTGVDDDVWFGDGDAVPLPDILGAWGVYGEGSINLNTAPAAVLRLIPDLQDGTVEQILQVRSGADQILGTADDLHFATMNDVRSMLELDGRELARLTEYAGTSSNMYVVTGYATLRTPDDPEAWPRVRAFVRATVQMIGGEVHVLDWREGPDAA